MKLAKRQLMRIIKEEIQTLAREAEGLQGSSPSGAEPTPPPADIKHVGAKRIAKGAAEGGKMKLEDYSASLKSVLFSDNILPADRLKALMAVLGPQAGRLANAAIKQGGAGVPA